MVICFYKGWDIPDKICKNAKQHCQQSTSSYNEGNKSKYSYDKARFIKFRCATNTIDEGHDQQIGGTRKKDKSEDLCSKICIMQYSQDTRNTRKPNNNSRHAMWFGFMSHHTLCV